MEKSEGRLGDKKFTTKRARDGKNKTFHICDRSSVPEGVVPIDCEEITGLTDTLDPPKNRESWGTINGKLDEIGCPNLQDVITLNCKAGRMRSPTMAGLYMIRCLGMNPDEAMQELLSAFATDKWPSTSQQKVQTYLVAYVACGAHRRETAPAAAAGAPSASKSRRLSAGKKQ
jgi:hypothetical protein